MVFEILETAINISNIRHANLPVLSEKDSYLHELIVTFMSNSLVANLLTICQDNKRYFFKNR